MMRTCRPQPAAHSRQTLGFHTATPGTNSSSGMKRMSWSSGLPQLASAAVVPVMAVTLMNSRRSITWLEVTRQAVVRRLPLPMAVHAEAHDVVDRTLGHGTAPHVTMARRAFDAGADVRRVVEPDVRLFLEPVDALPGEVDALLLELRELLNQRALGGDRVVADHAGLHARKPGDRALRHGVMTVLGALQPLADVDVVRKGKWLLDARPDAEEMSHGFAERPVGRREHRGCCGRRLRVGRTRGRADLVDQRIRERRRGGNEQQRDESWTGGQPTPKLSVGVARATGHHVGFSTSCADLGSARRLGRQAADVVHEVPHLLRGELAPETLHPELRWNAVSNSSEDLAVGHFLLPPCIGQVAWMRAGRGQRAVSLGAVAVTVLAVFLIQLLPRRHRLGAGRNRIFQRLRGWITVGRLGPGDD